MKDVLLVGGGHSHVVALDLLRKRPLEGARITLVSDVTHSVYSGMVPGYLAGFYREDECRIDLPTICSAVGVRFVQGEVVGLDTMTQRVALKDGSNLSYDVLSIASGSKPPRDMIPGATAYAVPVKPLEEFLSYWRKTFDEVNEASSPLRTLIVGGGAGGVEVALALKQRLKDKAPVILVEGSDQLLGDHADAVRRLATRSLLKAGVELRLNAPVQSFDKGVAFLATGEELLFDAAVLITGAEGAEWIRHSSLEVNRAGFILVGLTLQSLSHENVFASGDAATIVGNPRPKSGVHAVRQGEPLLENLRRCLSRRPLKPYHAPQRTLNLIGTGSNQAILSWGPFAGESKMFWKLKQMIDRRFIRRFQKVST